MKPTMKPYTATFHNTWDESYVMFADGISYTHANARAWIKFIDTQWFKDAPNAWELKHLEPVFNKKGEYITA